MIDINFAQLIGFFGFFVGVYAFLQKSDIRFKGFLCVLFVAQTLHFYLLGSQAAAAASFISFVRTVTALKFKNSTMGYGFITINIVWGGYLYTGIESLLAIIGTCLGTYAMFFLRGIKMRLTMLIGTFCWLIHNFAVHSIGGTLLEGMILITNMITITRLYIDQKSVRQRKPN